MTLVELLIGLFITGLVTSAAISLIFAAGSASDARNDIRKGAVRAYSLDARLRDQIQRARTFLSAGPDELIVWAFDSNADAGVNLDEIVMWQRDPATKELRRYKVNCPPGTPQPQVDAASVSLPAASDFSAVVNAVKGTACFPYETGATQVEVFSVSLDQPIAQSARVATISITLLASSGNEVSVVVGSIRSPLVPAP